MWTVAGTFLRLIQQSIFIPAKVGYIEESCQELANYAQMQFSQARLAVLMKTMKHTFFLPLL